MELGFWVRVPCKRVGAPQGATDVRDAATSLDTALAMFPVARFAIESTGRIIVLSLQVFYVQIAIEKTGSLIYVASPTLPPFVRVWLRGKHIERV